MGYIKKLKNNELVGGTDKTTIYPVTSTEAVFEEITNGNESSFKSQKTINKEQQDELDDHADRLSIAEAQDVKTITINGSTKKFEVDSTNNVDLTIYTVDSDPDMPDIADNVRDLRNMVGTSTPVLETSHKTRIENLETTVGTGGTIDSRIATTRAELQEQIDTKQIQLHVGSGLILDNNGNLSATLDPAMSKVVTAWPSQSDAVKGLIYLKPTSTAGVYEQRVYNDTGFTVLDNVALSISTDDALNTGSTNPLKNSTVAAQIGYFDHTGNNDNDGSSKVKNITAAGFTLPTTAGGAIKIKMKEPNTYAGTQADPVQLQFNNVTSTKKTLFYNHELVSATNTWEENEVISVYYDGTYYQASNAQGGGGKAEKIKYDNSQSGLAAENVQGALDELAEEDTVYNDTGFNPTYESKATATTGNATITTDSHSFTGVLGTNSNANISGITCVSASLNAGKLYKVEFDYSADFDTSLQFRDASKGNTVVISSLPSGSGSVSTIVKPLADVGMIVFYIPANSSGTISVTNFYIYEVLKEKLYQELGNNVDGAVSQAKVTDLFTSTIERFDYDTASTDLRRTATGYAVDYMMIEREDNGFKITCKQVGGNTYASILLSNLSIGETYYLSYEFYSYGVPSSMTPGVGVFIDREHTQSTNISWKTFTRNTYGSYKTQFVATQSTLYLGVNNYDIGAVGAYNIIYDISLTTKKLHEHLSTEVEELTISSDKNEQDIYALQNKGENLFDISEQTVGQTNASNFSVVKTDGGFKYSCINSVSNTYTWASVKPLIVGKEYILSFDYTSYIPGVWKAYMGLCVLCTNPSSTSPTYTDYVYLTQDNGHCAIRFTAFAATLYLRIAAADLSSGSVVELSNISLSFCSSDEIRLLNNEGYERTVAYDAPITKHYYGNPLPSVSKKNTIGFDKLISSHAFPTNESVQGCAAWNELLFEFSSKGKVNIYNLKNGTFVQQVTPTDDTGVTESYAIHYNNAAFSTIFYDSEDTFPLLYASGESRSNSDKAYVYRIIENDGVFSMSIIQKISFKHTYNGSTYSGYQQIYIDTVENKIYSLILSGGYNWYKFDIPNVKDGDTPIYEVTLTDSDIVDSFTTFVSPAFKMVNNQGGIIVNGIAYTLFGVPSRANNRTGLLAVDLWNKRTVSFVDLTSLGWYYEPEGLAFYDNHLYMNTGGFVGAAYPNSSQQHTGNDYVGQGIFKLYF